MMSKVQKFVESVKEMLFVVKSTITLAKSLNMLSVVQSLFGASRAQT